VNLTVCQLLDLVNAQIATAPNGVLAKGQSIQAMGRLRLVLGRLNVLNNLALEVPTVAPAASEPSVRRSGRKRKNARQKVETKSEPAQDGPAKSKED
jgi:hypothetical protein